MHTPKQEIIDSLKKYFETFPTSTNVWDIVTLCMKEYEKALIDKYRNDSGVNF